MDVDPTVSGNYLRITSISHADGKTEVAFSPTSMRRYYTLTRRESLTEGAWIPVDGQTGIHAAGGELTLTDEKPAAMMIYRVTVNP